MTTLIGQRVFGIALGYEDLNDHDQLRHDPVLAVLAGKLSSTRETCAPVAGKSTLNRLELSREEPTRYHKIAYNEAAIEALPVTLFLEAHQRPPKQIILDLDATDDPLHRGDRADRPAIRARWPHVRILLRADSGFAREALMTWCEDNRVDYVFGLARNARLRHDRGRTCRCQDDGREERPTGARFKDFQWSTLGSAASRARLLYRASAPRNSTASQASDCMLDHRHHAANQLRLVRHGLWLRAAAGRRNRSAAPAAAARALPRLRAPHQVRHASAADTAAPPALEPPPTRP